jgi:hypothetical protein
MFFAYKSVAITRLCWNGQNEGDGMAVNGHQTAVFR